MLGGGERCLRLIRDRLVAVYQMYTVHESILRIAEMLNRDVHAPIAAEPM
jgi:hypothetical protein